MAQHTRPVLIRRIHDVWEKVVRELQTYTLGGNLDRKSICDARRMQWCLAVLISSSVLASSRRTCRSLQAVLIKCRIQWCRSDLVLGCRSNTATKCLSRMLPGSCLLRFCHTQVTTQTSSVGLCTIALSILFSKIFSPQNASPATL